MKFAVQGKISQSEPWPLYDFKRNLGYWNLKGFLKTGFLLREKEERERWSSYVWWLRMGTLLDWALFSIQNMFQAGDLRQVSCLISFHLLDLWVILEIRLGLCLLGDFWELNWLYIWFILFYLGLWFIELQREERSSKPGILVFVFMFMMDVK